MAHAVTASAASAASASHRAQRSAACARLCRASSRPIVTCPLPPSSRHTVQRNRASPSGSSVAHWHACSLPARAQLQGEAARRPAEQDLPATQLRSWLPTNSCDFTRAPWHTLRAGRAARLSRARPVPTVRGYRVPRPSEVGGCRFLSSQRSFVATGAAVVRSRACSPLFIHARVVSLWRL